MSRISCDDADIFTTVHHRLLVFNLSCVTAGRSVALDRRLRSNSGDVEEERSVSEREEQQVYFYNLVFLLLLLL